MLSNISASVKLFAVVITLTLAQMTWVKGRIDSLTDKNIEQAIIIEKKSAEISRLEKAKFLEEGLNEIISKQHEDYLKLLEEFEEFKSSKVEEIKSMTKVERDEGKEIDLVWDIYRGTR